MEEGGEVEVGGKRKSRETHSRCYKRKPPVQYRRIKKTYFPIEGMWC